MKKTIKKILKETLDERKLKAMTVWFNNYVDTLVEVIKYSGMRISFREYGENFAIITIEKNFLRCFVYKNLWDKFSELFSLNDNEIESFISKWVENTYQLKGVDVYCV